MFYLRKKDRNLSFNRNKKRLSVSNSTEKQHTNGSIEISEKIKPNNREVQRCESVTCAGKKTYSKLFV